MQICPPAAADLYVRQPHGCLREQVRRILAGAAEAAPPARPGDRRRHRRFRFPFSLQLQPVNAHLESVGETLAVRGKQISEAAVEFFHNEPLPYRRVVVRLDGSADRVYLLADLSWCRFNRDGWYENGGRFLSVVEPAAVEALDWAIV